MARTGSSVSFLADYIVKIDGLGWRVHKFKHALVVAAQRGAFLVRTTDASAPLGAANGKVVEIWHAKNRNGCSLSLKGLRKIKIDIEPVRAGACVS